MISPREIGCEDSRLIELVWNSVQWCDLVIFAVLNHRVRI
jgi:hypothetical protein